MQQSTRSSHLPHSQDRRRLTVLQTVSVPAILDATLKSRARKAPQIRVFAAANTRHKIALARDRWVLSPFVP